MSVPKRRPPRPHSCNRSRSPLRQRAAANPSQVMKPNRRTKTLSATQLTCSMSVSLGGEVDNRRGDRADDHPQHLVPIKERHAYPVGLGTVVEGRPQNRDELHEKQQVPPAPATALALYITHGAYPLRLLCFALRT